MKPDPMILDALAHRDAAERHARQTRQAALHRAAVERRRKAKRGGKR